MMNNFNAFFVVISASSRDIVLFVSWTMHVISYISMGRDKNTVYNLLVFTYFIAVMIL